MTIPHDPLLGVRVKVDRAKKHLADLDTEIREYHARNPYAIIPEIEAETGDEVHRLLIKEAIPAHWGAILGDVVHNLRSSLDLLAAEMVLANIPSANPGKAAFPIAKAQKTFEKEGIKKIEGASDVALNWCGCSNRTLEGTIRFGCSMRLIIETSIVSSCPSGAAFRNFIFGVAMHIEGKEHSIQAPPLLPADRQFPLQNGDIVYRRMKAAIESTEAAKAAKTAYMQDNVKFTFEVAFGEGQVFDGAPINPTLLQLVDYVEGIVDAFAQQVFGQPPRP